MIISQTFEIQSLVLLRSFFRLHLSHRKPNEDLRKSAATRFNTHLAGNK